MTNSSTAPTTVQIYGPSFSSFVRSVMLICEQHQIGYTTGFAIDGDEFTLGSAQHLALHPYAKMPVLKHNQVILPETASICRYLVNTFASEANNQLSVVQQAIIDSFCSLATIYLNQAIMRDYVLEFAFPKGDNGEVRLDKAKAAQPAVIAALQVIDNELANGEALNNDTFSIADALIAPQLYYLSSLPGEFNVLDSVPAVKAYFNQLMTLSICQKILVPK
ncbi:glutathione S-transferase family protein [Thalassotalea sp. G2M2-11]|uniref:glutathione S-transferase family protein n=1 Tax=Thalassotalea sp. G2M2-11 TaxID=2787627 RepID=UPI0019D0C0D1|nr:glutathione S-transferase family protein [Thalassotalea sp. G2M2-11]